jgi:zinc protease
VQAAARRYFDFNNYVQVVLHPAESKAEGKQEAKPEAKPEAPAEAGKL